MRGHLTVICGPMFGGKTTALLQRVLWAKNGQERPVVVVKPRFDNRYSETRIVSHDGLSTPCSSISCWEEIDSDIGPDTVVFIDEAQFFEAPNFHGDIEAIVEKLLNAGNDVVANGLDMDTRGKVFRPIIALLGLADEVIKTKAHCAVCGQPASKTQKMVESDDRIELGSTDKYQPRCNRHWTSN